MFRKVLPTRLLLTPLGITQIRPSFNDVKFDSALFPPNHSKSWNDIILIVIHDLTLPLSSQVPNDNQKRPWVKYAPSPSSASPTTSCLKRSADELDSSIEVGALCLLTMLYLRLKCLFETSLNPTERDTTYI